MTSTALITARRRGIVLVLVLALLALLALIGVTFATLAGQGRINARNFAQSVLTPEPCALMDFALQQLIADTGDVCSALRGHSLARDMFGNDARNNGYLAGHPSSGAPFTITKLQPVVNSAGLYDLQTNIPIPAADLTLYGYNFTRWTLRLLYSGSAIPRPVDQTLEVLYDNFQNGDQTTAFSGSGFHVLRVSPADTTTALDNPTAAAQNGLASWRDFLVQPLVGATRFILDGRRLNAFNGPGMGPSATYGNFRYNGGLLSGNAGVMQPGDPGAMGMDEDYDACDLENWFLAIQSADGQVIIPSFHRPGIIRYDPRNGVNDWARKNPTSSWADSAARILRPVAADGHDPATFPDLVPDPATGKITFDVDNDADGVTDSVWLDLGYPARPDSSGRLSKPLFAFLVIGLNGRIPLNSAGNLAGAGATHAAHLGNSVSELDPTYALQNANQGPAIDSDPFNIAGIGMPPYTSNCQVDNAGIDVRLTQLRNLLAGTRPQPNPTTSEPQLADPQGTNNGDDNFVFGAWRDAGYGQPYFMPNGIADPGDILISTNPPRVQRLSPSVPGRWGEAVSIPGVPFTAAGGQTVNWVANPYNNPVRAGYSFGPTDWVNGTPRAAADDNNNQFDPFPLGHSGEVNDRDFFDSAGGLMLPVDRMRRFVTPIDLDGSGKMLRWGISGPAGDVGADTFGRVDFAGYFRPPGAPGLISIESGSGATTGAIVYPSAANDLYYTAGPNPANAAFPSYLPDATNNPHHGFEAAKNPNLPGASGGYTPQAIGGMPADQNVVAGIPDAYPTYDLNIRTVGLNEADEMNLYRPNPLLDSVYGPADLEWLYRSQDVDATSLSSRLANLAPISFTNTIDGTRRRRLFAVESWDSNEFVWANDNPQNAFPFNSRFAPTANASFATVSAAMGSYVTTPSLAHRDRKINLNYPLPVSNDPDELIRQKWIADTYQLLKWILPPRAVDTPEELAQLSQFAINVIDFRDPDCTMTHWINPDVMLVPGQPASTSGNVTTPATPPTLVLAATGADNAVPLDQYGMESNPVALNEVLAFSYAYSQGSGAQANRFFVELVNTLTQSAFAALPPPASGGTNPPDPSTLDLGGFPSTPGDPYSGGCWDLVFTDDTPNSRPDPYRGELVQGGQFYALIPLTKDSFTPTAAGATGGSSNVPGSDVTLVPLGPAGVPAPSPGNPTSNPATPPTDFFYAFGNSPPSPAAETGSPSPTNYYPVGNGVVSGTPSLVQYLSPAADPFNGVTTPSITWYPGVLPGVVAASGGSTAAPPAGYQEKLPTVPAGSQQTKYYWICLRRPANPFAPVSAANPMRVVDAMRFPYIDATAPLTGSGPAGGPAKVPNLTAPQVNTAYSAQRFQPYRGGHAVPVAAGTPAGGAGAPPTLDARYGYTEQIAAPTGYSNLLGTRGVYYTSSAGNVQTPYYSTNPIYHTLGIANDQAEPWDYFPFHDRDFTGVAELMLVPGCPPGLFTKQFAEFAPSRTTSGQFAQVLPQSAPRPIITPFATAATAFVTGSATNPMPTHTFPYLVDKFFYTGASSAADTGGTLVGGPTGDGWFRMFAFFEVPSPMIGATGPIARGTDFDWEREDRRPGQLNLNLIVDEEAFFSVVGQQHADFNQQWLNFIQVPSIPAGTYSLPLNGNPPIPQYGPPVPMVVTAIDANGSPAYVYPVTNQGVTGTDPILAALATGSSSGPARIVDSRIKAAFAQFLWLRHGGSGYLFGFGSGATGQNSAVVPIAPVTPAPAGFGTGIPAERPFRSLSSPDIDTSVMRPATLPPSPYTNPPSTDPSTYTADPGVRNPALYPGYATQSAPTGGAAASGGTPAYPGAIPVRRLFQLPDASAESNASESGDSFIDNQEPTPPTTMASNSPPPAPGALPPVTIGINGTPITFAFNQGYPNLVWSIWSGNNFPANSGAPVTSVGLGQPSDPSSTFFDAREHPFWRIEMLQRAMNLTTVRTHQYAVWITVGFFAVKRQGDISMIASGDPRLAFDVLGPEIGLPDQKSRRYRGFFLVDRLKLDGFASSSPRRSLSAVVYRQPIQ
jgi:large repetitive protein